NPWSGPAQSVAEFSPARGRGRGRVQSSPRPTPCTSPTQSCPERAPASPPHGMIHLPLVRAASGVPPSPSSPPLGWHAFSLRSGTLLPVCEGAAMSTNISPSVVGVLDNAVEDIVRHSGYLTTSNIERLLGAFPEW